MQDLYLYSNVQKATTGEPPGHPFWKSTQTEHIKGNPLLRLKGWNSLF
jgi:hypothetical protein